VAQSSLTDQKLASSFLGPRSLPKTPIENDSPARQFIRRMHAGAAPFTGRSTIVLYGKSWLGTPRILGSGVPLIVGGLNFIVTAAHTLDASLQAKRGVYLSPGVQGGRLVSLADCAVHGSAMPSSGNRIDDLIDLRVIRLTDEAVDALGEGIQFIGLDRIDADDGHRGTCYFLHGFPRGSVRINWCRRSFRSTSFPYGTIAYGGERGVWEPMHPDIFIDLDFHPEKNVDDFGRKVRPPKPEGVSGCGIWRLFDGRTPTAAWSVDDSRLVAIEHRWERSRHILRGTRIVYVNQILARNYQSCREEIEGRWGRLPFPLG
jgi:hypothetical protein